MNIKGVVAIQNYGSSGSLFLHSLLDNHPSLLSLPALYSGALYRFWEENICLEAKELVEKFVISPYQIYWFNPDPRSYEALLQAGTHQLGPHKNKTLKADKEIFEKTMLNFLEEKKTFSRRDYIESVYRAWHACFPKKMDKDIQVVFAFHSNPPIYAEWLAEDFKVVKFIYTLRNPINSFISGFHFLHTRSFLGQSNTETFLNVIQFGAYSAYGYGTKKFSLDEKKYKIQYAGVRLEDLHQSPTQILTKISQYLEIKFLPIMLESTFEGLKWWNRTVGVLHKSAQGFSPVFLGEKKSSYLNKFDVLRLKLLLKPCYIIWNYPFPEGKWEKLFKKYYYLIYSIPFKREFFPATPFISRLKAIEYIMTCKRLNPLLCSIFLYILRIFKIPYGIIFGLYFFLTHYIKIRTLLFNRMKHIDTDQMLDKKEYVLPIELTE